MLTLPLIFRVALIPLRLLPAILMSSTMRLLFFISPSFAKSIMKGNMKNCGGFDDGAEGLRKAMDEDETFGKGFIASTELIRLQAKALWREAVRQLRTGSTIKVDIPLADFKTKKSFGFPSQFYERFPQLLKRGDTSVLPLPLVLNFGSCT